MVVEKRVKQKVCEYFLHKKEAPNINALLQRNPILSHTRSQNILW